MSDYNSQVDVNTVVLSGGVIATPEVRFVGDNKQAVAEVRLAVNNVKGTSYVNVTFWGNRAEVAAKHFKPGTKIHVVGRISFDEWTNNEGQKRSKIFITADNFQFMPGGPKKEESSESVENTNVDEIPFA